MHSCSPQVRVLGGAPTASVRANPYNDPKADDLPDTPKPATWQKVVLGVVTAVATAVVAAPVAVAVGDGCLAVAPACAAEIAEMVTGGASGGSLTIGGAAAAGASSEARSTVLGGKYYTVWIAAGHRHLTSGRREARRLACRPRWS